MPNSLELNVSPAQLHTFANHPFHVRKDMEMNELVDSIRENGVLTNLTVRRRAEGGYEIISGHRRFHAAQRAGLDRVKVQVRDIDDDQAIIDMVDSNIQREHISPMEKAKAYAMKLNAIKHQGSRTDLTSGQIVQKSKFSVQIVGEQAGENYKQVQRYIRLTNLIPDLLDRVDNKTMAFNAAVEVSYLTEQEQIMLCDAIEREECTPNLSQAKRLKQYSQDSKLDENVMDAIMTEEKPIEDKLVLKGDVLAKYFPKTYTPSQKQKIIVKLLEDWHKRQLRQQER